MHMHERSYFFWWTVVLREESYAFEVGAAALFSPS